MTKAKQPEGGKYSLSAAYDRATDLIAAAAAKFQTVVGDADLDRSFIDSEEPYTKMPVRAFCLRTAHKLFGDLIQFEAHKMQFASAQGSCQSGLPPGMVPVMMHRVPHEEGVTMVAHGDTPLDLLSQLLEKGVVTPEHLQQALDKAKASPPPVPPADPAKNPFAPEGQ